MNVGNFASISMSLANCVSFDSSRCSPSDFGNVDSFRRSWCLLRSLARLDVQEILLILTRLAAQNKFFGTFLNRGVFGAITVTIADKVMNHE